MSLGLFTSRQLHRVFQSSFFIRPALKHGCTGKRFFSDTRNVSQNQDHHDPAPTSGVSKNVHTNPGSTITGEDATTPDGDLVEPAEKLNNTTRLAQAMHKVINEDSFTEQLHMGPNYDAFVEAAQRPGHPPLWFDIVDDEPSFQFKRRRMPQNGKEIRQNNVGIISEENGAMFPSEDPTRMWTPMLARLDDLPPYSFLPNKSYHYPKGHSILNDYLMLRRFDAVKYLQHHHYDILAKEIFFRRVPAYMNWLAEDLLASYPHQKDPYGFYKAIVAILNFAHTNCPLPPTLLLKLYNELMVLKFPETLALPNAIWQAVYEAALKHPAQCYFTLESLVNAFWVMQIAQGRFTLTLINLTNTITIELLMNGEDFQSQALGVFRKLVEQNLVPNVRADDSDDASFKMFIARSIIKGYLASEAYHKALPLVERLLVDPRWALGRDTTDKDRDMTAALAIEVLDDILRRHVLKAELVTCGKIITMLTSTSKGNVADKSRIIMDVPESTVLQFYDRCRHFNMPCEAAAVYVYLRSPEIRERYAYGPPRRNTLVWLFDYLADPGLTKHARGEQHPLRGRVDMAKAMLQDIIQMNIHVPVNDRPRVLVIAASRSFVSETQHLYNLWSSAEDPDHLMISGSAAMLVPVVKLFVYLQETWDRDVTAGIPEDLRRGQRDGWQFATRAVAAYMQVRNPIQEASQMDLNALARTLIELDRTAEGLAVLQLVMKRSDIPDIKDLNVVLLAIARFSVDRAIWTLEYMISRGIMPTGSTFSALIHMAYKADQRHLIPQLLERAKSLGLGELTPKGIATLVHTKLEQNPPRGTFERNLYRVRNEVIWDLVQTIMNFSSDDWRRSEHKKHHILSVGMGHRYVRQAVAVKDARLAMDIWRTLLKGREDWEARKAVGIRTAIAKTVVMQDSAGHLHYGEAKALLEELKMGHMGVTCDGVHVGVI